MDTTVVTLKARAAWQFSFSKAAPFRDWDQWYCQSNGFSDWTDVETCQLARLQKMLALLQCETMEMFTMLDFHLSLQQLAGDNIEDICKIYSQEILLNGQLRQCSETTLEEMGNYNILDLLKADNLATTKHSGNVQISRMHIWCDERKSMQ